MYLITWLPVVILPFLSKAVPFLPHEIPTELNLTEVGFATFRQPINHDLPDSGTFTQHYAYSYQYWKGPGSPIVFGTPGESSLINPFSILDAREYAATAYFSNLTTMMHLAKELGRLCRVLMQLSH